MKINPFLICLFLAVLSGVYSCKKGCIKERVTSQNVGVTMDYSVSNSSDSREKNGVFQITLKSQELSRESVSLFNDRTHWVTVAPDDGCWTTVEHTTLNPIVEVRMVTDVEYNPAVGKDVTSIVKTLHGTWYQNYHDLIDQDLSVDNFWAPLYLSEAPNQLDTFSFVFIATDINGSEFRDTISGVVLEP